ncbi:permease [Pandoraea terrae]|uniref:Probable membrane transporter protein n=1 Tax=Pandoraea terrae TaxID=1537710 RepID=A0A5E4Z1L7_9BURK|nr:sulfite exporter TauE/SafE family protein [Pandoraea terrae]VVE54548.1 permease [Pandoraea terrae]
MGIDHYVALALTVVVAYAVFGLTGFGAAMVAVPVLVQFIPLHFVVPMLLMLDLVTTTVVGMRNWSLVSRRELTRLFPFMLVGVVLGTSALAKLDSRLLLIGLGAFVLLMTVRTLLRSTSGADQTHGIWAIPAGVIGGAFSALFGTGGPIYTMYLSRRLTSLNQFRATISAVIFVSAVLRLLTFATNGLLHQADLLRSAVVAMPFSLFGLAVGARLRQRIAPHVVRRALLLFLAASGVSVLYRGLMS